MKVGAVEKHLCGRSGKRAVEGGVMTVEQLGGLPNGRAFAHQALA
jgi:hypothetical protein